MVAEQNVQYDTCADLIEDEDMSDDEMLKVSQKRKTPGIAKGSAKSF